MWEVELDLCSIQNLYSRGKFCHVDGSQGKSGNLLYGLGKSVFATPNRGIYFKFSQILVGLCPYQNDFNSTSESQVKYSFNILSVFPKSFDALVVIVVVVYSILSRLLYLAFSANLGLLSMPHSGMGPLV